MHYPGLSGLFMKICVKFIGFCCRGCLCGELEDEGGEWGDLPSSVWAGHLPDAAAGLGEAWDRGPSEAQLPLERRRLLAEAG